MCLSVGNHNQPKTHPMPNFLVNAIELTALVFLLILSDSHPLAQMAEGNSDPTRGGPLFWLYEGGVLPDTFLQPTEDTSQIGNGKHNTMGWIGHRGLSPNME